jgi:predicted NBD/HSP70 family sugar kinase
MTCCAEPGKMSPVSPPPIRADHLADAARRRPNLLRALSEQEVLAAIFAAGTLSRPQIAARTGLSKVTVGAAVDRLARAGLVSVSGPVHGARGRSPLAYRLAGRAGYVIGIDLEASCARAAASDIVGELIAEAAQPAARQTPRALSAQVLALVNDLIERAGPDRGPLLAIGVSVPGVVDQSSRRVTALAHNLSPDGGLDPLSALRGRFDVPVLIDNDVNLAALGELWHGAGRGQHTFALMSVGVGVGMGIVIDGTLVRGAHGAAGEVGYLPSGIDPFAQRHRLHGGLEDDVGEAGLLAAFAQLVCDRPPAPSPSHARELLALAHEGDLAARTVLDQAARRIGAAIASVIAVLDPELVVLGGEIGADPWLLGPVREAVAQLVPLAARIESSTLGERASLRGAIALALRDARAELFAR